MTTQFEPSWELPPTPVPNRELDWNPGSDDNWWLIALEKVAGDLPVVEPHAFDPTLNEDQQEIMEDYEQAYEAVMDAYTKLVKSFGYIPRFGT